MSTTPQPNTTRSPQRKGPGRGLVYLIIGLVLGAGGVFGYFYYTEFAKVDKVDVPRSLRAGLLGPDKLDAKYTDADGDLVADAPKDTKDQADPPVLYMTTLEGGLKKAKVIWGGFVKHLAEKTGKKVVLVEAPPGMPELMERMTRKPGEKKEGTKDEEDGPLHIASLSTGAVPLAVNRAGFVPAFVLANDEGKFAYQMEVIVAADSNIQTTKDLKGKTITLTSFSSLSSFRAPVEMLYREHGYLPGRDYSWRIVTGQPAAIRDVCKGETDVAAVANDLLARVVNDPENKLDPKVYRSIHKSVDYPPFCIGWAHNLKPELQAKLREAFKGYAFDEELKKSYEKSKQTKFVEVDYKKDWENVRKVDAALREMVEQKTK
jgi:phosphonate transport system substrate-binding protein